MKTQSFILAILILLFANSTLSFSSLSIDSLKEELKTAHGENRINALEKIAILYYKDSTEKALDYFNQALETAQNLNMAPAEAEILYNIGRAYHRLNNFDKALVFFERSLSAAIETESPRLPAKNLNKIGLIYKDRGDYELALEYFKRALKRFQELGEDKNVAAILNNIGIVYRRSGNHIEALEYYLKALTIRKRIGDKNSIAQSLSNIGTIYKALDNLDMALKFYQKAYNIGAEICQKDDVATFLNNIGNIYMAHPELKDLSKSLDYYNKAIALYQEANDLGGVAISLGNIGNVYNERAELKKSLQYYKRSLKISREIGDKYGVAKTLLKAAKVYLKMKDTPAATNNLLKSVKLAGDNKFNEILEEGYLKLSEIYTSNKDFNKALKYNKMYSALRDTLNYQKKSEKLIEKMTSFISENDILTKDKKIIELELDKQINFRNYTIFVSALILASAIVVFSMYYSKRKTNKLHETANTKLKDSEKALRELNSTKDRLFSIIAHDLKSPLGVFKNMTKVLADNYNRLDSKEILENLIGINRISNNLFDLIDNLLQWARAQKGEISFNPETIDLQMIVNNSVSLHQTGALKKNIRLFSEIQNGSIVDADVNMVSIIMRNLISNAVKFTEEMGEIKIVSADVGNFIEISVIDTGVGISPENIDALFRIDVHYSTFGTMDEKGTGLGLILCKEFVEENGGEIRVKSEIDKGTAITFTLPKAIIS